MKKWIKEILGVGIIGEPVLECHVRLAGARGFTLRSADSENQLKIRGVMHLDGRYTNDDEATAVYDTAQATRMRPIIEGTLGGRYDFRFTPEMTKEFNGDDRFFPITYQKDWAVVRRVAEESGTPYNKAAYEKETAREVEAARKKAEEAAKKKAQ